VQDAKKKSSGGPSIREIKTRRRKKKETFKLIPANNRVGPRQDLKKKTKKKPVDAKRKENQGKRSFEGSNVKG